MQWGEFQHGITPRTGYNLTQKMQPSNASQTESLLLVVPSFTTVMTGFAFTTSRTVKRLSSGLHDACHAYSPLAEQSGVHADQATFKSLLSLWSPKIILVCSYSQPCQDVFGPVCGHILHSCIQNGLQDPQSASLYSKASHALCDCARPKNVATPC